MCLVAYNLIAVSEGIKARTEEAMALSFDIKEKMPEGMYLMICDYLKKVYESIDYMLTAERSDDWKPFEEWPKDDQTEIKNQLAQMGYKVDRQLEIINVCETMNGITSEELSEIFNQYVAVTERQQASQATEATPDTEDIVVVRFVHGGVSYFRATNDLLYQEIEGENELVGRYNSATDVIDFDYRED